MQWFMEDYFKKAEDYQKAKMQGAHSERPSVYADGLAVLANRISKELGPDYTWKLMGPFGVGANSSLWFTKNGEDMLKHGGYALNVCPTYDQEKNFGFALASGKSDFAGNPTKHFDMPESFEKTLCFLTRYEPISPDNAIVCCYEDVVSIPPADLYVLKDMMQLSGAEILEKYGHEDTNIGDALRDGKNIVYTFHFKDGKQVDLEFAINVPHNEQPWLLVALYDENDNLIAKKQPAPPKFSFPGEFKFVADGILYSANFGVAIGKDLYPAGLDNISSVEKSLHVMFLEKHLTLNNNLGVCDEFGLHFTEIPNEISVRLSDGRVVTVSEEYSSDEFEDVYVSRVYSPEATAVDDVSYLAEWDMNDFSSVLEVLKEVLTDLNLEEKKCVEIPPPFVASIGNGFMSFPPKSCRSIDDQIQSASTRSAAPQPTDKAQTKEPIPEL